MASKKIIELEFAVYTDVTEIAKALDEDYFGQYEKIFVCVDTNNSWVARILPGYNKEYEQEEGKFLLERNNIEEFYAKRGDLKKYAPLSLVKKILIADSEDGCNYDVTEVDSVEDAIEMLDGGFGIN